nr:hypothetical protein Iba_chr13eCG2570 [Ipomoea batatas]
MWSTRHKKKRLRRERDAGWQVSISHKLNQQKTNRIDDNIKTRQTLYSFVQSCLTTLPVNP